MSARLPMRPLAQAGLFGGVCIVNAYLYRFGFFNPNRQVEEPSEKPHLGEQYLFPTLGFYRTSPFDVLRKAGYRVSYDALVDIPPILTEQEPEEPSY